MAFIHGDDYVASGRGKILKWMADEMNKAYDCKVQILGLDEGGGNQPNVLNGNTPWQQRKNERAIAYDADPRHSEILVEELGLDNSNKFGASCR